MAVWERGAGPGTTVLRMSSQRPDGHWTRPQTLASSPASYLHTYDLELGPHGTALVVWSYGDNVTHVMETHREGGSWSTPRQLNGHNGDVPDGTIDGQGVMTVAWQGYGSRGSTLVITARPPGGDWARPRALSEHGGYPTVASNQDGDVAVAWGVDRGAEVFLKKAGEPWSPVKTLISGFWPAYVDLLVAPDGRALALWSLDPDGDVAKKRHLAWAQTDLDGTWSDVGFLDTRDVPTWGTEQSVSMNSDGEVFALWQASSAHSEPYKTAYFDFDTGWTSPKFFAGWRYCCLMNTWLSDTGTAVAIFGPKGSSRTASWAYRTPGQRWQKADMNPTTLPIPYAVDGDGERLVLLQFKPNLQSRTLVLPPPPTRTT